MGLVAPRHVGFSRTRARTRVPCTDRWILNHRATREALNNYILYTVWKSAFVPTFYIVNMCSLVIKHCAIEYIIIFNSSIYAIF